MSGASAGDYTLLEQLGEGSFGKVYKALHLESRQLVAVKVLQLDPNAGEQQMVAQEIETLKQCESPNIVQYFGSFSRTARELWIVMEFCVGSSLHDIMEARRRCLTERQINAVISGALTGLQYLHRHKKIHRDVKSGNLLLSESGVVKLADFGVATTMSNSISRRGTVIGTPFWMAPEVIAGGPAAGYDAKADVWSLGITAIELAEGAPPHASLHPMRAIFLIPTRPPPNLTERDRWSESFVDFVTQALVKEVDERPSSEELLAHGFLSGTQQSEQREVLQGLIAASLEALHSWREEQHKAEAENEASRQVADSQEIDLEGIRSVAQALTDFSCASPGESDALPSAAPASVSTLGAGQGAAGRGLSAYATVGQSPPGNGSLPLSAANPLDDGGIVKGSTLRLDSSAVRGALYSPVAAAGDMGTMIIKDNDAGDSGTMVFKSPSASAAGAALPAAAACESGTVVIKPDAGGSGSAVTESAEGVPAFLRAFQPASPACKASSSCAAASEAPAAGEPAAPPASPPAEAAAPQTLPPPCSARALATPTPAVPTAAALGRTLDSVGMRAAPATEEGRNKYDFSHMSVADIDAELSNIGTSLERDIGKLKRKYEKRERLLRAARTAMLGQN